MAEEIENLVQQQPTPYLTKVYSALKDNLQGFDKTPEQFVASMKDVTYASKAYAALKDNLTGFDKTPEQFYGEVGLKKKPLPSGGPNTLPSFQNGLNPFQASPQSIELAPVLPEHRNEIAQQQQRDLDIQKQRASDFSNRLKQIHESADPALKKELDKIPGLPVRKDVVSTTPQDEVDHMNFMNSTMGKIVTPLAYLGSKATHGTLQITKGVAHLMNMANNPATMGLPEPTDAAFDKLDDLADLNLSKGDIDRIETGKGAGNHILSSAGMVAQFAPAIAGGEAAAGTTIPAMLMYLQGVGMGKETADKMPGLNPLAKEALIQGTGIVNLALTDLGNNLFNKGVSNAVKDKVVAGIAADAIKSSAGKSLSADSFESLLKGGVKSFAEKFERAPMEAIKHYTDAAETFAKLDVGNFAVHKAVDTIQTSQGDEPVFNETVGDLAENLNKSMTESVPTFGTLGALRSLSKLLPNSSYENDVVKSVLSDPSPENVDAIKQQIHDHGFSDHQEKQWTPEEMDATFKHVDQIAEATRSIPTDLPEKKRSKAVSLVLGRNALKEELARVQESKSTLDASIKDIPTPKEEYLTDKIEQADDKLRGIVSGNRATYSKGVEEKEEGKFFKTVDGTKEEISPNRYELENTEREAKKQDVEPAESNPELPAEQPPVETVPEEKVINQVDETGGDSKVVAPEVEKVKPTVSSVPEVKIDEELSPAEADRLDIEKETNPKKIAARYDREESAHDYVEKGVMDYLGKSKINLKDYEKWGDRNNVTEAKKLRWLDSNNSERTGLDQHAEILSDKLGVEVTPQNFIDVIDRYAGTRDFIEANKTDTQRLLEERYQQLTGKKLTERRAKRAVSRLKKMADAEAAHPNAPAKSIGVTEKDVADLKKKERAAKAVAARIPSLNEQEATRKMELRKKFGGQLNDITRIPTLLADKEFREYAGLVLKEAGGDFKAFSRDLIETIGDAIKDHLPQLFKELGGKETGDEPIGISKAETTKQRKIRGLEGFTPTERLTLDQMFENGKEAVKNGSIDPKALANEVANKPRNLDKTEVNALLYDRQRIRKEIEGISTTIDQKIMDKDSGPAALEVLVDRRHFLDQQLAINEAAVSVGARENSLALNAMKGMIASDYSYVAQRSRMRALFGGELTPEMETELNRYKDLLDEANKKLKDYQSDRLEKRAKKIYDQELVKVRKEKKVNDLQVIQLQKKAVVKDFLAELKKQRAQGLNDVVKASAEFVATAAPFIKKMVPLLLREGIIEFKDVIATIHETFAEHIDGLTERDVMDVLAGKYNEKKETKNQLLDQRNAIVKLSKLTSKLEDLKRGLAIEKSERKIVKTREDIAKVEAEIKDIEKANSEALRPERERQAYIKQLKKGIADIDDQIAAGEKTKPNTEDKYADDETIKNLRDERTAKQDELNEIDPSQKEEAALSNALKATEKSIADLEKRIADKDLHPEKKEPKDYNSPELTALREKRDELSKQMDELKKNEFTPEEKRKMSLRAQLDRINERIDNKDFSIPDAKEQVQIDAEEITLQSKVNKAQNNYEAMAERITGHKKSLLERSLNTYTQVRRALLLSGVKTLGKLYSFAALRSVTTPIEEVVNTVNTKTPWLRKIAERSPRFSQGFNRKAEAQAISTRWSQATLKDSWVEVLQTGAGELDRLYGKNGTDKDFDLNPPALEFFGRLHGAFKNSTKRAEFFRSFQKRLEFADKNGEDINDPNVQFSKAQLAYTDGKRAILMNDNILVDKGYKNMLRGLEQGGSMSGKLVATALRALFPIVKIPTNYVLETYDAVTGAVPGLSRATPYIVKAMIDGADSLSPKQADMVMRTLAKGQIGLAAMLISYNNPQMFGGYYSGKRDQNDLKAGDIILFGHKLPHFMAHNPIFEAMQIAATMRRAIDAGNGNGAPTGIMETLTTKKRNDIEASAKLLADKSNPDTQLVEVKDGNKFYNVYIKKGVVSSISKEGGVKDGIKNSLSGLGQQIPFTSIGDFMNSPKTGGNIAGEMVRNQIEPRLLQEAAELTDTKDGEHVKRDPQTFTEQLKVGVPGLREQVSEKGSATDKKLKTIKLDNDTEYKLTDEQAREREVINNVYIEMHAVSIRERLKIKNLTEHDIQTKIQQKAMKYSKSILYHKYKDKLEEVE